MSDTIVIDSEDYAWELLEKLNAEDFNLPAHVDIEFKEWPNFDITLRGDIFHGTIPTSVMSGIVELQNSFYRSYAKAKYEKYNMGLLSKEDKELLEINVKIKEGCTDISSLLSSAFTDIVKEMLRKMSPDQVMIVVISLGAMYFGKTAITAFLEKRRQDKELDFKRFSKEKDAESQKFAQEQETERLKLISSVAEKNSDKLGGIVEESQNGLNALLKGFNRAESVSMKDNYIESEALKKLVDRPRKTSSPIRFDGAFRVSNVDNSDIEGHKIKLHHLESGRSFICLIKEGDVTMQQWGLIFNAIIDSGKINLSINAKERRDEIVSASILSVSEYID